MEPPPAKRLRILQSIEPDEENPEYVAAKQKQQRKFKGRLESIFAKFENMHESMSDEIDMRNNSVVVDRGHLRRLERQVGRHETMLLDTLGATAKYEHFSEKEEDAEDSEDELGFIQPQKPVLKGHVEDGGELGQTALSPSGAGRDPVARPDAPLQDSSNAAHNLLHLAQFPRDLLGQQGQAAFYTALTQTINQAVQQAVAPLFSSLLPHGMDSPLQLANTLSMPSLPLQTDDRIAPATDPKWYFPPLSARKTKLREDRQNLTAVIGNDMASRPINLPLSLEKTKLRTARSSPKVVICNEKTPNLIDQSPKIMGRNSSATKKNQIKSSCPSGRNSSESTSDCGSSRNSANRRTNCLRDSYNFADGENMHVFEQKNVHGSNRADIRASGAGWNDSPLAAFRSHYSRSLRKQGIHIRTASPPCEDMPYLPTPSSLEYEHNSQDTRGRDAEYSDFETSLNTHLEEGERDPVLLTSSDIVFEQRHSTANDKAFSLAPEDSILPSVEADDLIDKVILGHGSVENPPAKEASIKIEDDTNIILSENVDSTHQTPTRQLSSSIDLLREDEIQTTTFLDTKHQSDTPLPRVVLSNPPVLQTPKPPPQRSDIRSSKSTSRPDRKTFQKQVKQCWAQRSSLGSSSSRKTKSIQSLPTQWSCVGDADSEDELA